ncbi:MAG TPA: alpha/beta fold hydrolase [Gemmatimonadaceae bacterium]|nr:alpha/beta fold hydrolase [Gemmatimonadaceae bacterium]
MLAGYSLTALAIALGGLVSSLGAQPTLVGHWEGQMVRDGSSVAVVFDFSAADSARTATFRGTFGAPSMRAQGIPLSNISVTASAIAWDLRGDFTTSRFRGTLTGDQIVGQVEDRDWRGTFELRRAGVPAPLYRAEEVQFMNADVSLSGTLLLPTNRRAHSAVLFTHGAGAEGRHANRFIAEHFARRGIAALIYDKRGVGKSTGDWRSSDFDDLSADALAGIHFLKRRKEIHPRHIGLLGHSQGGTIAPLIASRSSDVAFVISEASAAVPMWVGEVHSLRTQVIAKGVSGADLAQADTLIDHFVNYARTGEGWDALVAAHERGRATAWYRLLTPPPRTNYFWSFYRRIADYNASEHWAKVTVPTLVVQAERDEYVPVAQSIPLIDAALRKAGNRDYTIIVLPRASHSFSVSPAPGEPFAWPQYSPGYADLLVAWIALRAQPASGAP